MVAALYKTGTRTATKVTVAVMIVLVLSDLPDEGLAMSFHAIKVDLSFGRMTKKIIGVILRTDSLGIVNYLLIFIFRP
jgi:hypothetical protein